MISKEHKDIAQWSMDFALKNGCSSARISVISSTGNSFEYRNEQVDKIQQSQESKLYIELFVENRYGSFSTNRMEKKELETFILNGIASTRFLAKDTFRRLPASDRYYKGNEEGLDLEDKSFFKIPIEQKLELLKNANEEIIGTDSRIVSVTSSYGDGCGSEYMIDSNGFEQEFSDTAFSLTTEVSLKTEGDARPESYWYDSAVYWADLKKTGIATKALERTIGKLGQQKISSGKYNMLLDNQTSSRMLSPLISALYGTALQQKSSFLLDKLGSKIASDKLCVYDRPHIKRSFGARYFDGEGVATKDRAIIENGVLTTYFIDNYNSLKMGIQPTIASPSIIRIENGKGDLFSLMKEMNNGIWVTGFNGGNCNPVTGDFSFGVEGFFIENGKVSTPVGEMNITGNMLSLWAELILIGEDLKDNSSWKLPSLVFEGVSFSGM